MIAKISSTANLGGALGYNFKKVRQEEATVLLANGLYQNQDGKYSMEQVLSDMRQLIPDKCRTKNTVFHCSLNPHPDEKFLMKARADCEGVYGGTWLWQATLYRL